MKYLTQSRMAGIAVTLYTGWISRDVVAAWIHSPFDRMGFPAFLVWFAPVVLLQWFPRVRQRNGFDAGFLIGLGLSLAGVALNLNLIKYAGLAFVISGFLPRDVALMVWLPAALSWMPVLGWALSSAGTLGVGLLRLVLAVGSALFLSIRIVTHEN
ncbi:MAG: hypothetical protein WCH43_06420 [Verrucomicrobiota bacterium]